MVKFWLVLVCLAGSIALWFSGMALHGLFKYWRLGPTVAVYVTEWTVQPLSSSRFGIEASYYYDVDGRRFCGKTLFEKPAYLNVYSAEDDLKKWQAHSWHAWYQASHPEVSSLQRNFPMKDIIQAFLTLSVFLYFCCARGWMMKLG